MPHSSEVQCDGGSTPLETLRHGAFHGFFDEDLVRERVERREPSGKQHELADGLSRLDVAMGVGHAVERIGGDRRRSDFARSEPRHEVRHTFRKNVGSIEQVAQIER